jgi:hypothetical protein
MLLSRKAILLAIFFVTQLPRSSFSQQSVIDSLENILKTTKSDSIKIITLVDLTAYVHLDDINRGFEYTDEAYKIAKKTNDPYERSLCLNTFGNLYLVISNYDKAIFFINNHWLFHRKPMIWKALQKYLEILGWYMNIKAIM